MTTIKKIEDLKGFRRPTEKESNAITEFFTAYFQRSIKWCKRLSSVASVQVLFSWHRMHPWGFWRSS